MARPSLDVGAVGVDRSHLQVSAGFEERASFGVGHADLVAS